MTIYLAETDLSLSLRMVACLLSVECFIFGGGGWMVDRPKTL